MEAEPSFCCLISRASAGGSALRDGAGIALLALAGKSRGAGVVDPSFPQTASILYKRFIKTSRRDATPAVRGLKRIGRRGAARFEDEGMIRMSSLPTAYANQRFGRKCLDFYAAAGDVIGADPRARAYERRLQDLEGARHTVRLMERGFHLEPGEQASVLRMQPGPARRSRPVAVVNHTTGAWSRTHPGATGLLARAGVARSVNWTLAMALFALAALAVVWPYLRAFLEEVDPALFARAPQFDVFALAAAAAPSLADWRLDALTAGLAARIGAVAPGLEAYTAPAVFGAAAFAGALLVHALRSWRLVWAPVFVAGLGVAALGFDGVQGAVTPALSGLAIAGAVFCVFGLVNRVRDAARLERRIAVLADHILRNPPEELVAAGADEAVDGAEEDAGPGADAAPDEGPDAVHEAETAATSRSGDHDAAGADAEAESQVETAMDDGVQGPTEAPESGSDGDAGEPARSESPATGAGALTAPEAGRATGNDEDSGDGPDRPGEGEDGGAPANTFEQEESERLRTDPRYASRAIVLPPPPPMPTDGQGEASAGEDGGREGDAAGPARSGTRTLKPDAPLPSNVVPIFAPPVPSRSEDEPAD